VDNILRTGYIDNINITDERKFHLIRHFSKISLQYHQYLEALGYTQEEILNELNLSASKLFADFAQDIESLLNKIKLELVNQTITYQEIEHKIEIQLQFPYYIGENNLVEISDLSDDEKLQIKQKYRGKNNDVIINYLQTTKKFTTRQLNIVLNKNEASFVLLTIFPGMYAPPFPNIEYQNRQNYDQNKDFWDKAVFVESR